MSLQGYDDDGTPTEPPPPEAPALALALWLSNDDEEAKAMEEIVRAYASMSNEQRVIIRALCREFTPKG